MASSRGPGAAGSAIFHALPPPTDEEIAAVLEQVYARVQRLLRRWGRLRGWGLTSWGTGASTGGARAEGVRVAYAR